MDTDDKLKKENWVVDIDEDLWNEIESSEVSSDDDKESKKDFQKEFMSNTISNPPDITLTLKQKMISEKLYLRYDTKLLQFWLHKTITEAISATRAEDVLYGAASVEITDNEEFCYLYRIKSVL